ncbi:acetyl-CoA carboxylase biotin carboxyl carrier protein subunit, partial [Ideonella sp.]|uniref:acetyl-CoA carboxylase biotin carboxyl carrier protein subunit n=1 Tax=Ideonella sp. TaxID=1929293 RepID=UPI003BB51292
LDLSVGEQHHVLRLQRTHDGNLVLGLGDGQDDQCAFSHRSLGGPRHEVLLDGTRHVLSVYAQGDTLAVFGTDDSLLLQEFDPVAQAGDAAGTGGRLTAPMPGKVIAFLAAAGQAVKAGQALAVMDAMKMEHTLTAPRDGVVAELLYAVGDQVAEGAELLSLQAEAA